MFKCIFFYLILSEKVQIVNIHGIYDIYLFASSNRDLLVYLLWQTGQLTNQQIGEKFGLTYSAVSSRVRIFKDLLKNNRELEDKVNQTKSLIKI